MALTRAGKKRESAAEPGPSDHAAQVAQKKRKTSKRVARPAQKKQPPKGLLDLSPELRNLIYHFATEKTFGGAGDEDTWMDPIPLVSRRTKDSKPQWPTLRIGRWLSGRNFLGLTQTCKQLRAEYRPIWLRNLEVRIRLFDLSTYLHDFYGCGPNYVNLPRLVQLSFNQDFEDYVDLTPMLRIRAGNPAIKFEFVPHLLTLDEGPWNDIGFDEECDLCEDEIADGEMDMEEYEEMGCPHYYIRKLRCGLDIMSEEYPYLVALNNLLAHEDPNWLEDLRSSDVTRVKLDTTGAYPELPDISIRLAPTTDVVGQSLADKSMRQAAKDYVASRNLKDVNTPEASLHFELLICGAC
ncbi:hypothetical protein BU23DRAFT_594653 [Bimuria novae-zelandiae CBS 107.79]|uniref:F-box domain-containing protein n=1 Tax=Bimuria novae-zelandiae CBS 107.79 TaxID=1447943 RepID=A0A6A5VSV3_9PLEO|nr:hypothetical protein BU23DRAFT_594653 [Bimuria novae-zelandiae CBS 107.79]